VQAGHASAIVVGGMDLCGILIGDIPIHDRKYEIVAFFSNQRCDAHVLTTRSPELSGVSPRILLNRKVQRKYGPSASDLWRTLPSVRQIGYLTNPIVCSIWPPPSTMKNVNK
jgi:hypothetical protein